MKSKLFFLLNIGIVFGQFLECSKPQDCIATDALCVNEFCECPKDKVYSLDGSKCLDVVFGYNSPCDEDQQCAWLLGNYKCTNKKCSCASGWVYYMGKCIQRSFPKGKCSSNEQCFDGYDLLSMVCKNNVCECNNGYYLRGENDCRPISAKDEYCSLNSDCQFTNGVCQNSICKEAQTQKIFNETIPEPKSENLKTLTTLKTDIKCVSNNNCATLSNSVCNLHFGYCICKRGYRYVSESAKCVAELGTSTSCTIDTDCLFKYSRCIEGTCYCRKTYFTISGNTACQKPMTHDNLFCNNNERCYVLGSEGICENHVCKCSTPNPPNANYVCDSSRCETNDDCGRLINSICIDKLCQCPKGFYVKDSTCLPELGSMCSDSIPCVVQNASCQTDVCTCNENFIQNSKACFKLATTINSTCEVQEQCSSVSNTECVNNICKCALGYFEIENQCVFLKEMGDTCRSTSQCRRFLGKNVVCRNGYCNCPVDWVPTAKKDDCKSSSTLLSFSYFMTILLLSFNLMSN